MQERGWKWLLILVSLSYPYKNVEQETFFIYDQFLVEWIMGDHLFC
jgi:hypothetical protein